MAEEIIFTPFDEAVLGQLAKRYGHWPEHERPLLWHVAMGDEYGALRHWMERSLDSMDESGRQLLVPKLRDPRSFTDAFHELGMAVILSHRYPKVEYERSVLGVTPDFLVQDSDGTQLLIEVWTRNQPDQVGRRRRQWLALERALAAIPIPLRLACVAAPANASPADAALVKRISRSVSGWLLSPFTQTAMHEVAGYAFVVLGPAEGLRTHFLSPGGGGGFTTADHVLKFISMKVDRYRLIADTLGVGLIVVVGGGPGSAMSHGLLRDTLAGKTVMSLAFTAIEVGELASATVQLRNDEKPPKFAPALSAVGFLDADLHAPPGELTLYTNPAAMRPLERPR